MAYGEMFPDTSLSTVLSGSFTPTILGGTTPGTGTYTDQDGIYRTYSNLVFFMMRCQWTAHTGSGTLNMDGFPDNPAGATSTQKYYSNLTTGSACASTLLVSSSDNVNVYQQQSGGVSSINIDTASDLSNTGIVLL